MTPDQLNAACARVLQNQTYHYSASLKLYEKVPKERTPLIDIGCGNGCFTIWLNENRGETIGLDTMIGEYKEHIPPAYQDRFFDDSIYDTHFNSDSFQSATADNVMEHLDRPLDALAEINRILTMDATFHVAIPLDGLNFDHTTLAHCWRTTEEEILECFALAGFQREETQVVDTLDAFQWVLPSCNNQMFYGIFRKTGLPLQSDTRFKKLKSETESACQKNIERAPHTKEARAGKLFAEAVGVKQEGRFDEAAGKLEKILDLNPYYKHVYFEIADCLAHQERYQEAQNWLDKLLSKINSDHAPARILSARLYKEVADSTNYQKQVSELRTRNPDVFAKLADAL